MWLLGGILTVLAFLLEAESKQQYFLVKPSDTEVIEGLTAMIQCKIKNLAGAVQWSKDGFLLGFDPAIPGFKRYSMMIDKGEGIYNLRISKTMLEDEGNYQCQVGPAPDEGPIRAGAKLTVLVPPNQLTINGRPGHAILRIKEGERVNLTCSAHRSKPPSRLKWYRNRVELIPGAAKTFIRKGTEKLDTVLSTLTLYPKMDDDEATYMCEADHLALSKPLTSSVAISVLYPPGSPIITGYREGDILRKGEPLSLTCISKGGNPSAQLIWYKSGQQLDASYTTSSGQTTSILRFTVTAADNKAVYRCEASSRLMHHSMSAFVTLSVHYPPEKVYLKGPSDARRGDVVTVVCTTSPSNPAVQIKWLVDEKLIDGGEQFTRNDSDGWITSSNLTVTLTRQDPDVKRFICRAGNPEIGMTEGRKDIKVTYPPGQPTILGNKEDISMQAGAIQSFVCVSLGGNPPASLQWYRGNKQISTVSRVTGSGVSSELVIKARREDNGVTYRCEATNLATSQPLVALMKISVKFPPGNASIIIQPAQPRAGDEMLVQCSTDSSNPEARITLRKSGREVRSDHVQVVRATNGGYVTTSLLKWRVTSGDDGVVFTCLASNGVTDSTVRDDFTVSVLYKPEFLETLKHVDIIEGSSIAVNMSAVANPNVIRYFWIHGGVRLPTQDKMITTKNGHIVTPRMRTDGPVLHLRATTRTDSGNYYCVAQNSEGTSNATVEFNVLYPAVILNLTENQRAIEGDNVTLECWVEANPINYGTIVWKKHGTTSELRTRFYYLGRSVIELVNVTRDSAGKYECNAFNGVGDRDVMGVEVIVMYSPVILQPVTLKKVGSKRGDAVTVNCTVDARPNVTFTWYLENQLISWMTTNSNYQVDYQNNEQTVWTSVLHIKKVHSLTYGNYTCRAENYLGFSTATVELIPARIPEIPTMISTSNITHNSVLLSWKPGFNGGLLQMFNIFWRKTGEKSFFTAENITVPTYLVCNLDPETEYEFFVSAINEVGISDMNERGLKTYTKPAPSMDSTKAVTNAGKSKEAQISRVVWMACAVCGAIVFVLISLIVACCIRRSQRLRRRAEVALQLQRLNQNDDSYKPVNNTDGQPFYLSGRASQIIEEEHVNTDHIQTSEHGVAWKNVSKNEESQGSQPSHLEEWGDEQIRKLGSCESLEEDDRCPDILKQYTRVCKDLTENVLFLAERESTNQSCFTNSSEEVSKVCFSIVKLGKIKELQKMYRTLRKGSDFLRLVLTNPF
ncbi:nephrin-like isoform X1 [Tachypleus tridentatus]|uniref:nephrin-like isoform X1 n=1 Tax=Tachypleus tridentatus TaxID=6853 RepID=UPI003FD2C82D